MNEQELSSIKDWDCHIRNMLLPQIHRALSELAYCGDTETAHKIADNLLIASLAIMGDDYDLISPYSDIHKWYA